MNIGIWGNYNYGNFGDDLMAISIAMHLKKNGHNPIAYRLDRSLASQFGIESEYSLEALLAKAECCLIGGGGMLVGSSRLKRYFSPISRKFEKDFRDLNYLMEKYKKRIYPISIGGDGGGEANFSTHRAKFFHSSFLQPGTVRLKEDLPMLEKFGKIFTYYPDILFDTGNQFKIAPFTKENKEEIWIGLNLISRDLKAEKWHKLLIDSAKNNNNIKLFFIKTHLPTYCTNYEFIPQTQNNNLFIHQYVNPIETLSLLASLDLVISSKLHIGLSALALGTPFFNFKGRGKTVALLRSLNATKALLNPNFSIEDFMIEFLNTDKEENMKIYDKCLLKNMINDSKNHYNFIDEVIAKNT